MLDEILKKIEENEQISANIVNSWLLDEDYSPITVTEKKRGPKEFTNTQKAAVFLICIGKEYTKRIFQYLDEFKVETVIFEISKLEMIQAKEKENVFNEFLCLFTENSFITPGGIDYAKEILEDSFGKPKAIDIVNRLTTGLHVRPFDFIRKCDPKSLLNALQQEHPQVIALILSYLEPSKSSVILDNLPYEEKGDVAYRISTMDRVNPEILREVERVLEKKLYNLSEEEYGIAGGVESMVEILNLIGKPSEHQIIDFLEDNDPELAEEIKKRLLVFEDIIVLDDRSVQKIMREVDAQELAKALIGVDQEVQDKIFKNMSKRAAGMLMEDMQYMGPVRRKDIEDSQDRIVSIIRHLEDTGEIVISRYWENELLTYTPSETSVERPIIARDIDFLSVLKEDDDIIKYLLNQHPDDLDDDFYLDSRTLSVALVSTEDKKIFFKFFNLLSFRNKLKLLKLIMKSRYNCSLQEIANSQTYILNLIVKYKEKLSNEKEEKND